MGCLTSLADSELLVRSVSDPAAFGVFYRRHAPAMLAFCTRRAGGAEAGTELTAEVFAAALQARRSFKPERADAVAWLFGIARNKLTDFYRHGSVESKARRRMGFEAIAVDDDELERVERLASLDVSTSVLQGALDGLPLEQKQAVIARVVHEMSYLEIGDASDASQQVVRQRVSRGLAALRQTLRSSHD